MLLGGLGKENGRFADPFLDRTASWTLLGCLGGDLIHSRRVIVLGTPSFVVLIDRRSERVENHGGISL